MYEKADSALKFKKEKLFRVKEFNKWELTVEGTSKISQIKDNQDLAFKYMCANETINVKKFQESHRVSNYFLLKEVQRFFHFDMEINRRKFTEMCDRFKEISLMHLENWGTFGDRYKSPVKANKL